MLKNILFGEGTGSTALKKLLYPSKTLFDGGSKFKSLFRQHRPIVRGPLVRSYLWTLSYSIFISTLRLYSRILMPRIIFPSLLNPFTCHPWYQWEGIQQRQRWRSWVHLLNLTPCWILKHITVTETFELKLMIKLEEHGKISLYHCILPGLI